MSQKVQDILAIYDRLDRRGDVEKIPVFSAQDISAVNDNPAFSELLSQLHEQILDVDVEMHVHVEEGEMTKAARANGELAGLTWPLRWLLEMRRYFKLPVGEEEE